MQPQSPIRNLCRENFNYVINFFLYRLRMQNPVMIFTKLLVRTSGWLLGATVLHLRGDFANFASRSKHNILCCKIFCHADLCFFQEAAWRDKDHLSQNVKFDSPFTVGLRLLDFPNSLSCLSSLYSIYYYFWYVPWLCYWVTHTGENQDMTLQLEHLVHLLDGMNLMQKWPWHGK